jgi:hypothetical protein
LVRGLVVGDGWMDEDRMRKKERKLVEEEEIED